LIRASVVCALSLRVLMASAALAAVFALGGCYGQDGYEMPTRAMKELSPEMEAELVRKNMPKDSPILVRLFKEESELEVWKQDTSGRYALLKVYPICRWSGDLGPKVKEGDRQAPEGFYPITPGLMNPNSNYYLAINTGFPNAYDRANNRHGAFLMIHGDCSSRGCYAMTDEQIGEIYSLGREAMLGGQKEFQIQAYPFRMTAANLARHRNNPNFAFWKMIKEGYDHFEVSHREPSIDVCDRHYVFDAVPPANSTKALNFNPTGACPRYDIDPEIAGPAAEKQRKDEDTFAELVKENAPVAPPNTGTDGGMNRVFAHKLDEQTYSYDNEGHVHVPPQQPGKLPPVLSPPQGSESETVAAIAEPPKTGGNISNWFGGLFGSKASAEPTPATGSVPAPAQTANTRPKPKPEPRKTEEAEAKPKAKPESKPQQQANAVAPPPASNNGGLIKGAQPVVPSGTFDSRWGGFQ
jgi:murein L,D-transpeptidase YafK